LKIDGGTAKVRFGDAVQGGSTKKLLFKGKRRRGGPSQFGRASAEAGRLSQYSHRRASLAGRRSKGRSENEKILMNFKTERVGNRFYVATSCRENISVEANWGLVSIRLQESLVETANPVAS